MSKKDIFGRNVGKKKRKINKIGFDVDTSEEAIAYRRLMFRKAEEAHQRGDEKAYMYYMSKFAGKELDEYDDRQRVADEFEAFDDSIAQIISNRESKESQKEPLFGRRKTTVVEEDYDNFYERLAKEQKPDTIDYSNIIMGNTRRILPESYEPVQGKVKIKDGASAKLDYNDIPLLNYKDSLLLKKLSVEGNQLNAEIDISTQTMKVNGKKVIPLTQGMCLTIDSLIKSAILDYVNDKKSSDVSKDDDVKVNYVPEPKVEVKEEPIQRKPEVVEPVLSHTVSYEDTDEDDMDSIDIDADGGFVPFRRS